MVDQEITAVPLKDPESTLLTASEESHQATECLEFSTCQWSSVHETLRPLLLAKSSVIGIYVSVRVSLYPLP